MAVRARTVVALRVEGAATQRAERTPGLDEADNSDGEPGRPLARESDAQRGVFFERLYGHVDRLFFFVNRHGDIARNEVGLVFGLEREVVGEMTGSAQLVKHLTDPFGQSGELELLALHDDQAPTFTHLKEEETIAHFAAHADHDPVGVGKVVVHDGLSPFNEPVQFTQSTIGVEPVKATALIEQGDMTVR